MFTVQAMGAHTANLAHVSVGVESLFGIDILLLLMVPSVDPAKLEVFRCDTTIARIFPGL